MTNWRKILKDVLTELRAEQTASRLVVAPPDCQALSLLTLVDADADAYVVVCATMARAEELAADFRALQEVAQESRPVYMLPEIEGQDGELIPQNECERARVFYHCESSDGVFFTSVSAALAPAPPPETYRKHRLVLSAGDCEWPPEKLAAYLVELDYDNEAEVRQPGEFSWRGGILDVYSPAFQHPIRIDYFGDEIESIRYFDPESQRSVDAVANCTIIPRGERLFLTGDSCHFLDYFYKRSVLPIVVERDVIREHLSQFGSAQQSEKWHRMLDDSTAIGFIEDGNAERPDSLAVLEVPAQALATTFAVDADELADSAAAIHRQQISAELRRWADDGFTVVACTQHESKYQRFLGIVEAGCGEAVQFANVPLRHGLVLPMHQLVLLSDAEMFGHRRRAAPRRRREHFHVDHMLRTGTELNEGDLAVHASHGVCRYLGLRIENFRNHEQEVLVLEFDDDVRVFVPLDQAYLVSRYIGGSKRYPRLSKIGGTRWRKAKQAAVDAVGDLAAELIRIQAVRETQPGFAFAGDEDTLREFEEAFPYEETEDQKKSIIDVYGDMEQPQPTDRLICGDVGYGKTEVAMRAACKAVLAGKQVCVLVPTTVLAQQHYLTFNERFHQFPVLIDVLSRFRNRAEQKAIVHAIRDGRIDIVIGTHRLLQGDIKFRDLGLIIIDEEQRFGVKHKERLKQIRADVDVLTMTATPIPRTLYLAMAGLRDMSTIATAPLERRPVQTVVAPYEEAFIHRAITREVRRGGQVFFLHNRVKTIAGVANKLRKLVPDATFDVAHGQMDEGELEEAMLRFIGGKVDVLVCTTIIESGLDIPNANTIIIDRADRFGLAELYQLRGRVGRYHRQAYAYLLLPKRAVLMDNARQRLAAIRQYTQLGAGFKLAMRDLEIRGAGNILGSEQSGHIAAIGFDLYCQLMRVAVEQLKNVPTTLHDEMDLQVDFVNFGLEDATDTCLASFPKTYIEEEALRVDCYRRLSAVPTEAAVEAFTKELRDRFGRLPEAALNMLKIKKLKLLCRDRDITSLNVRDRAVIIVQRSGGMIKQTGAEHHRLKGPSEELIDELIACIAGLPVSAA